MRNEPRPEPRRNEEVANAVTHGVGAALAVAALALLVVFASIRGDAWRIVTLSIYGATLVSLYLASTLYHSFRRPRWKRFFRLLDHSAIFLLIAGTYTPVTLVLLRGGWGWALFGTIWGLAVAGVLAKMFLIGRMKLVSIALYVGMGWLVLLAVKPAMAAFPTGLIVWLAIGGVSYTAGVVFFAWKSLPYHHAVWHLFVLGGSISHFFGMLFYLTAV